MNRPSFAHLHAEPTSFEMPPEIKAAIDGFSTGKKPKVSQTLRDPHFVIEKWLVKDEQEKQNRKRWYGESYAGSFATLLEKRRLRIINAILKHLEPLGCKFTAQESWYHWPIHVKWGNEEVVFVLNEPKKYIRSLLTKEDRLKGYYRDNQKWTQKSEPAGDLRLQIKQSEHGSPSFTFRDSAEKKLEEFIVDMLVSFVNVFWEKRKDRLERDERDRRWNDQRKKEEALLQIQKAEQGKKELLEEQAQRWHRAAVLRDYIHAVQTAAHEGTLMISKENLESWVSWVPEHANDLDPIKSGTVFLATPKA